MMAKFLDAGADEKHKTNFCWPNALIDCLQEWEHLYIEECIVKTLLIVTGQGNLVSEVVRIEQFQNTSTVLYTAVQLMPKLLLSKVKIKE